MEPPRGRRPGAGGPGAEEPGRERVQRREGEAEAAEAADEAGGGGMGPAHQPESGQGGGPSCDRVRPCIEAFVEIAPDDLAAPARIALAQLEASLAETPAREPACRAALASYRRDLETRELVVPEACR